MENKNQNCGCHVDKKDVNHGISCDVRNCVYHDGSCYCTADCISVGPSNACSSAETLCATFKHKEH